MVRRKLCIHLRVLPDLAASEHRSPHRVSTPHSNSRRIPGLSSDINRFSSSKAFIVSPSNFCSARYWKSPTQSRLLVLDPATNRTLDGCNYDWKRRRVITLERQNRMRAKLRFAGTYNPLLPGPFFRPLLGTRPPHIAYANLEFGTSRTEKDAEHLLDWLGPIRGWSSKRILDFLKQHQEEFRRCLDWLAAGCVTNFELSNDDPSDDSFDGRMSDRWKSQPAVRLLQLHGLVHGGVSLEPYSQDGSSFSGTRLDQGSPRDPLDPICWYLLSLLMLDGTIGVRRCEYSRCRKYFRPWSAKKRFCDDNCRSKSYAEKKSPEDKRNYMREHRKRLRLRALSRKKRNRKAH